MQRLAILVLTLALSAGAAARAAEEGRPGAGAPSGAGGEAAPEALDPSYLALPPGETARLTAAVQSASKQLEKDASPGGQRVRCWLRKLGDAKVDDRLVEWTRVCPAFSREGLRAGQSCRVTAIQQDLLLDELPDVAAFDKADGLLHLAIHLRSFVTALGKSPDAAQKLLLLDEDVEAAKTELAKLTPESRSRHYLALQKWLEARKGDRNSLYSPCE
jgi:hypothetical protein